MPLPNLFASRFPQSDNLLINSYADELSVLYFNSNVDQIAEALSGVPYDIYVNNGIAFCNRHYPRQNALFKKLYYN